MKLSPSAPALPAGNLPLHPAAAPSPDGRARPGLRDPQHGPIAGRDEDEFDEFDPEDFDEDFDDDFEEEFEDEYDFEQESDLDESLMVADEDGDFDSPTVAADDDHEADEE